MDYYHERYNIRITDKNQPMLVSMPKDRDRRGGRTDPVLVPPEMCIMTGLSDEQRSNFNLMKSLSVYTRQGPAQRMEALRRFRKFPLYYVVYYIFLEIEDLKGAYEGALWRLQIILEYFMIEYCACSTRLSKNVKAIEELKTWGMELDPDLVPITGRRLDPELVILGNRSKPYQCDAQADWTTSMCFLRVMILAELK